jgi:catechol-2,3-dioxygenase
MMHVPGIFGAYLQVPDLERSLSFYRDVLGLEVSWNDAALAVLHGRGEPADTLILRATEAAAHHTGDSGVTRMLWRVREPADLDNAEEVLVTHQVAFTRHQDPTADGISFRDPDGLGVLLVRTDAPKTDKTPPPWLYWSH